MANINVGNLPVAISVTGDDYIPLDQGGVTKRAKASLIAGTATGFVPTTRRIDAGVGLSGGGTLATDVTINFDPSVLFAATTQAAADQYVIQQAATSLPKTITFANSMKAIGTLTASPALDLTADKFVVLRAADGLTYSATASQISLAAGNVPAGGTTGQVLAKNSSTNYDTAWINNSITLDALSIAANPTGGATTSTSVTLGATLAFSGSSLRTAAATGDVTWSANSFATTIAANAVTNAKFRQSVAVSVVGNATNATADVADIAGTANQILRVDGAGTGLAFGSIDLAQTATVGTSILPVPNGGTGVATTTAYALLAGGTTSTGSLQSLAGVGTSGQVLVSNGAGNLPTWQTATAAIGQALTRVDDTNVTLTLGGSPTTALLSATSLTLGWTGQLALTRGGTAASLTASDGGIVYSTATAMAILSGTATAGQIIRSGSSTAPSWSTSTYPATSAAGTILASGTDNTITATATPTLGVAGTTLGTLAFAGNTSGVVTITPQAAAGTPTLTFPNASGTFAVSATAPITLNTTTGAIGITSAALTKVDDTNVTLTLGGTPGSALLAATSLTLGWTGQLALTRGGTAASLTASNGGIVYSTATAMAILSGTATANQILMSGSSAAPAWSTATYPATTTINQLLYSSSANTIAGLATANGGILNANSSGVPSITTSPTLGVQQTTRGQLILANTAAGAFPATLQSSNLATAATTLTLPPDAGTSGYVLSTDGAGVLTWVAVGGTGTVTSLTPGSGLTSTITGAPPGSAITTTGTLSSTQVVNAQTGTTYTVLDSDRAGLVTFSNASSIAVTLPQAGAASAFQAGWFVTFRNIGAGVVTITPTTSTIGGNATLVLTKGQSACVTSDGTNYQVSARTPLVTQAQCRLDYVSTTQIQLNRYNGQYLFINGQNEVIPATGPTLANTGLTAATLYYIYAYMSSGTMTLEASATAPTSDATFGIKIKTGDATRSLVGMVYMDAGTPGTFADSATARWVISYYNRVSAALTVNSGGLLTVSSSPWVEISSTLRTAFLHWADETISCATTVMIYHASANVAVYARIGFGVAVGTYATGNACAFFGVSAASNYYSDVSTGGYYAPQAGLNTATLQGGRDSGTGNYASGYTGYTLMIVK